MFQLITVVDNLDETVVNEIYDERLADVEIC